MAKYKLTAADIGKTFKTEQGNTAEILCDGLDAPYPFGVKITFTNGSALVDAVDENGQCEVILCIESDNLILPEPAPVFEIGKAYNMRGGGVAHLKRPCLKGETYAFVGTKTTGGIDGNFGWTIDGNFCPPGVSRFDLLPGAIEPENHMYGVDVPDTIVTFPASDRVEYWHDQYCAAVKHTTDWKIRAAKAEIEK